QDFERRRFLRDKIEELEAARARAAVELQKLPVLQLRSRREGRWDVARLQRDLVLFQNELRESMEAYEKLFHEKDAYRAQAQLEEAMRPEGRIRAAQRKADEALKMAEQLSSALPEEQAEAVQNALAAQRALWELLDEVEKAAAQPATPGPTGGGKKP